MSRMNTWTLSLHWSCLVCWSTGLKLSRPKTKLQNVGVGDPSSTILIDNSSYAVLPTIDRLQLGWLTRDVDPRGWEVLTPWMYVGRARVCFDPPLKMLHSFIQNCCCITASFTASRMNSWTLSLHLHWSCLCWLCYHPYIWSAPSRSCPPISAFAAILGFKLSWLKTKLQNVNAGDLPSTILIAGIPVEGVEEFIYLGSKQSSNGYCRLDVLCRIGIACSVMNSLQRVWNCSNLSISTKVHLYQSLIRSVLL